MSIFLESELTEEERGADAFFQVIPVPLERTVSYGAGTREGPAAILEASNELERECKGKVPCAEGIYTHAPVDCEGPLPEVMARIAANNALCHLHGDLAPNVVNPEVYDSGAWRKRVEG